MKTYEELIKEGVKMTFWSLMFRFVMMWYFPLLAFVWGPWTLWKVVRHCRYNGWRGFAELYSTREYREDVWHAGHIHSCDALDNDYFDLHGDGEEWFS